MTATPDGRQFPAYLVKGDDVVVVAGAVRGLVAELVAGGDPALIVEELSGDSYDIAAVVDAAQTPPFFGDRRVVIARDVGRFASSEVATLVGYLANPLPTTTLVLVAGGGQIARTLTEAVRKVGHVLDAGVPSGRGRAAWVAAQVKQGPVRLDARASAALAEHLGEDVGRLGSLLETLAAAHGEGARLGVDEVAQFLGQAGAVPPWALTDAIDGGDIATALEVLHRLLDAGNRHPLVILSTLHSHFTRMLRLEGAGVAGEVEAAAALGITGSTFPAKKALVQARRLGHAPIARAVHLLAEAELALKGAVDWPAELVMEVLVARLCRLSVGAGSRSRR